MLQTDRRTDGQADGRTFRLIESIGPGGRCFETYYSETKSIQFEGTTGGLGVAKAVQLSLVQPAPPPSH